MHIPGLTMRALPAGVVVAMSVTLLVTCHRANAAGLQLGAWQHPTDVPIPVAQAAAATDPTSGLISLAGGFFSDAGTLRSGTQFQIYEPSSNTWSAGPNMPLDTRGGA